MHILVTPIFGRPTAIGGEDSAQAFENSLTASYEGSHPLYVCEDQNSLGVPSATLS